MQQSCLSANGILSVGIDSFSIEAFVCDGSVHLELLGNGCIIIELLDLSGVTEGEYEMAALPLRLAGLDGAPARVVLMQHRWGDVMDIVADSVIRLEEIIHHSGCEETGVRLDVDPDAKTCQYERGACMIASFGGRSAEFVTDDPIRAMTKISFMFGAPLENARRPQAPRVPLSTSPRDSSASPG